MVTRAVAPEIPPDTTARQKIRVAPAPNPAEAEIAPDTGTGTGGFSDSLVALPERAVSPAISPARFTIKSKSRRIVLGFPPSISPSNSCAVVEGAPRLSRRQNQASEKGASTV
jgi:hypothetical protein